MGIRDREGRQKNTRRSADRAPDMVSDPFLFHVVAPRARVAKVKWCC